MDPATHKFCQDAIAKISKNSNAYPFLEPVDPVKLNIPDYFEKIKFPMDLSTISAKLANNEYTLDTFKDDFTLMINNCYTYNPPNTPVYKCGVELEKSFNNIMKKKRISTAVPPKTPAVEQKKAVMSDEEYNKAMEIYNSLMSHTDIVWPFLERITDELVPGYSAVIKNPTDMRTIKEKLDQRSITLDDFYKELKLMLSNCFKFNNDVKKIYDCALEMDRLVDSYVYKNQNNPQHIKKKVSELKEKIKAIEREISILNRSIGKKSYTLEQRLEIGNAITKLNTLQTTKIAQIINKSNVTVDFISKNEIEVDLRLLGDETLNEIEEYIFEIEDQEVNA